MLLEFLKEEFQYEFQSATKPRYWRYSPSWISKKSKMGYGPDSSHPNRNTVLPPSNKNLGCATSSNVNYSGKTGNTFGAVTYPSWKIQNSLHSIRNKALLPISSHSTPTKNPCCTNTFYDYSNSLNLTSIKVLPTFEN